MNAKQASSIFGCTEAQIRAQYMANAKQLAKMAEKARVTGKKVGGYTAIELEQHSFNAYAKATA